MDQNSPVSAASEKATRVLDTVRNATRVQDSELQRWRKTFDTNAKTTVDGEKYVPSSLFWAYNSLLNGHLHSLLDPLPTSYSCSATTRVTPFV